MVEGLFPYFASHLCISAEARKLVVVSNTYWLLTNSQLLDCKLFSTLCRQRDLFRDLSALDPPSPIPNLEVKQRSADGTTAARLWESKPSRGNPFSLLMSNLTKQSTHSRRLTVLLCARFPLKSMLIWTGDDACSSATRSGPELPRTPLRTVRYYPSLFVACRRLWAGRPHQKGQFAGPGVTSMRGAPPAGSIRTT
jgi:hypothetical protein